MPTLELSAQGNEACWHACLQFSLQHNLLSVLDKPGLAPPPHTHTLLTSLTCALQDRFADFTNIWHSFASMFSYMLAMFDYNGEGNVDLQDVIM